MLNLQLRQFDDPSPVHINNFYLTLFAEIPYRHQIVTGQRFKTADADIKRIYQTTSLSYLLSNAIETMPASAVHIPSAAPCVPSRLRGTTLQYQDAVDRPQTFDHYIHPGVRKYEFNTHDGMRRGTYADTLGSHVVWVDVDTYKTSTAGITSQIQPKFVLPPTLVVCSGRGYHAYWRLVDFETDIFEIRAVNRWLRFKCVSPQGDKGPIAVTQELRMPYTINSKWLLPSYIAYFDANNVYPFSQFPRLRSTIDMTNKSNAHNDPDNVTFTSDNIDPMSKAELRAIRPSLPDWLVDKIIIQAPYTDKDDDRSKIDFSIACELFRRKLDLATVRRIFLTPNWCSPKTINAIGYVRTTLISAEEHAKNDKRLRLNRRMNSQYKLGALRSAYANKRGPIVASR